MTTPIPPDALTVDEFKTVAVVFGRRTCGEVLRAAADYADAHPNIGEVHTQMEMRDDDGTYALTLYFNDPSDGS